MGAVVAAVIVRREREIVEEFRAVSATSPERAVLLDPHGVGATVAARRLKRRAVLREAGPDRYWLDEPSWEALRSTRRRVAMLLIVLVAAVALAATFASRTHEPTVQYVPAQPAPPQAR